MANSTTFRPPVQASTLLSQLIRRRHSSRLTTGVAEIDNNVLLGGIPRGCVVGISSGFGAVNVEGANSSEGLHPGRLLVLHLMVRALLVRPASKAAIVDSTGNFPLRVLARVIRRQAEDGVEDEKLVEEKVEEMLERISITRVFDIEGLKEVLEELQENAEQSHAERGDIPQNESREEEGMPRGGIAEIGDSEDDDTDILLPAPESDEKSNMKHISPRQLPMEAPATEIILVDTFTPLVTTLLANAERENAHAMLASLSALLRDLTHSSMITAFLLNSLTLRTSHKASSAQGRQRSVFAGVKATPSLGVIFDNFSDLHLMRHCLPASATDAEKFYDGIRRANAGDDAGRNPISAEEGDEIDFANIIEVLRDEAPDIDRWIDVEDEAKPRRSEDSEQLWTAFRTTDDGVGLRNLDPEGRNCYTG